jgi:peptide-methionine (S)-S-oxide reductase
MALLIAVYAVPAFSQKQAHRYESAVFAGGCFWCMEPPFDALRGVVSTVSGYAGGDEKDPTYEEVSAGRTGHAESIEVTYDPTIITYASLVDVYWHNIDPTSARGQFCDKGTQYRPVIFYRSDAQRLAAEESKDRIAQLPQFKGKVAVEVVPLNRFYPAEEYHQDFYKKEPDRYYAYRRGCGRDKRLKDLWGDQAGH